MCIVNHNVFYQPMFSVRCVGETSLVFGFEKLRGLSNGRVAHVRFCGGCHSSLRQGACSS